MPDRLCWTTVLVPNPYIINSTSDIFFKHIKANYINPNILLKYLNPLPDPFFWSNVPVPTPYIIPTLKWHF